MEATGTRLPGGRPRYSCRASGRSLALFLHLLNGPTPPSLGLVKRSTRNAQPRTVAGNSHNGQSSNRGGPLGGVGSGHLQGTQSEAEGSILFPTGGYLKSFLLGTERVQLPGPSSLPSSSASRARASSPLPARSSCLVVSLPVCGPGHVQAGATSTPWPRARRTGPNAGAAQLQPSLQLRGRGADTGEAGC